MCDLSLYYNVYKHMWDVYIQGIKFVKIDYVLEIKRVAYRKLL